MIYLTKTIVVSKHNNLVLILIIKLQQQIDYLMERQNLNQNN
ncbi:DcaP family trimeric outer membrane transporter, partial [Acinetobacter baumannii]